MNTEKYKLVVYVPSAHTSIVLYAIGKAGAGKLGKYSHCSYTSKGTGRFLPGEGASPYIGEVGKFEEVEEDRIEVTVEASLLEEVVSAMKSSHPYEEVAYDIYPLVG